MKLFTIGDSISQGFMSLAAARTELSYSTLVAKVLGLRPEVDYPIPTWHKGGLPLNIEKLLRKLERRYGANIRGPIEWPLALLTIEDMLDDVEDHYERGSGNIAMPQAGPTEFFPNVSARGFTVGDAWMVTPDWCVDQIVSDRDIDDNSLGLPNKSFARTAHAVLNPSRAKVHGGKSQVGWLEHHARHEGVENVALWLGSNNALGTVLDLKIKCTDQSPVPPLDLSVEDRDDYNLWTHEHFAAEYELLLDKVLAALRHNKAKDWRIFVATVPAVSIAPLAKGVGTWEGREDPFGVLPGTSAQYAELYTYVLFDESFARRTGRRLIRDEVYRIDKTIAAYNRDIRSLVEAANGRLDRPRLHIVDINDALLRAAFKRNGGNPSYPFPAELRAGNEDGGVPLVNTVYYHVDRKGTRLNGGLFSLDGVHPSAIGHGLLALEFLKVMQAAKVPHADPDKLDWTAINASDTLFSHPIKLMPELYDNTRLAEWLVERFAGV
ncbi:SGNH/GDSL hydrolase family protein [Aerophototrophica crusticola]|uniref:SGNH/GDSL hydrolase family protein n=1 Tax=Aerophototrophica crusticola TaxID=1709002 RepID=A0A858R3W4_9PROT|nr:SGNH/GDSL hydrolase family protein [Rhodospirillaceae bacterium B3]